MKNARKIVRIVAVVSIIGAGLALAACETTKGVGKDIQYGAQKTQDALDGKK
ncbi:MAG: entericidin [bacterium]